MYRLVEYVNNYVGPERDGWNAARKQDYTPLLAKANAGMFEAFLWLHLGVEIGVFPEENAIKVVEAYFDEFFTSLVATQKRFEGRTVTSAPSLMLDELRSRFSSLTPLLNMALQRNVPFSFQRCGFSDVMKLRAPFDVILMLMTAFVRNSHSDSFTTAVTFLPDIDYDGLMKKAFGVEFEKQSFSSEDAVIVLDSDPGNLYEGFQETNRHMMMCRDLFRELRSSSLESDASRMLFRFREIHRWRIDLRNKSVETRFKKLHEFFTSQFTSKSGKDALSLVQVVPMSGFESQEDFYSICEFWSPKAFEAGAS